MTDSPTAFDLGSLSSIQISDPKRGPPSRRRDCHLDDTPFCIPIETPTEGMSFRKTPLLRHLLMVHVQGGCSRMAFSPTARAALVGNDWVGVAVVGLRVCWSRGRAEGSPGKQV